MCLRVRVCACVYPSLDGNSFSRMLRTTMKNDLVTMDTEALASELMRKSSFNPDNQHKFSS